MGVEASAASPFIPCKGFALEWEYRRQCENPFMGREVPTSIPFPSRPWSPRCASGFGEMKSSFSPLEGGEHLLLVNKSISSTQSIWQQMSQYQDVALLQGHGCLYDTHSKL